jgi:glycine dehydrogenase subunit 1
MPFIPHTEDEIKEMLTTIGVNSIESLFDEISPSLRQVSLDRIPGGISEMELGRLMRKRAAQDSYQLSFIGAGAYEHHIPAAVWKVAARGEFYTAYTPYQAEASQGSLQLIYEYQTMMANLMSMDVSNASLYDGASALAEAILMAVRIANPKKQTAYVLTPRTLHPFYRATAHTIVRQQNIELIDVPYDPLTGNIQLQQLETSIRDGVVALIIPQPNFFGVLEEVDKLTDWAKKHRILSVGVVNPMAMALLTPPGQWGESGVDIVCGDGQPLGIPLASGGPYYGFLCTKRQYVRQMPGRIVGRTIDMEGKPGYVLTLQAREQHIRRDKATSNICTNQGLMVTASTIYMSLMGPVGLRHTAILSHQRTKFMREKLLSINGIKNVFSSAFFHEIVLCINQPTDQFLSSLAKRGIQAGYALDKHYPELNNCLLLCSTETKTEEDIAILIQHMSDLLEGEKAACYA